MASGSHPLSIFREYILQLNYFPEIINPNTENFDLILGFASEKGTGQFVPTWNVAALSPQRVMELKDKYPKVRVVISIGGVGSEFNPPPNIDWVTTAVNSIKAIIQQYNNQIDGIDIHYDVIKKPADNFAGYIGQVIQRLKNDPELSIKVVSIAPTQKVQDHYRKLYSDNKHNIDWVDYRFYNQQFPSMDEFIKFYKQAVAAFEATGKVLAGISIPQDPKLFDGIKYLIRNNLMPAGVFVWNADKSLENELQNL